MIRVFIDANIFLSFYHLTSEDLNELKKLVALIDSGIIDLLLPVQVVDEFWRNRSAKVVDALRQFNDVKFPTFPALAKQYSSYEELRNLIKNAQHKLNELTSSIRNDAISNKLAADAIVTSLFEKGTKIPITDDLYAKALKRVRLGNPPGKDKSFGDAINWECLLLRVPMNDPLHFVSGDKDYRSQFSDDSLHEFLTSEWEEKKKSKICYYSKISDFFVDKFPHIKLASQVEAEVLIQELSKSKTFSSTHKIVARLSKIEDFSPSQVERLVDIGQINSQVAWIMSDRDVHEFYASLLDRYKSDLSEEAAQGLAEMLNKSQPKDNDFEASF